MHNQLNWSIFPLFCIPENKRQGAEQCVEICIPATLQRRLLQESETSCSKKKKNLGHSDCCEWKQSPVFTGLGEYSCQIISSKQISYKLPCSSSVLDNWQYTFWSDWTPPPPAYCTWNGLAPSRGTAEEDLRWLSQLGTKLKIYWLRCDCPRYHWSMKTLFFMQKWEEKMRFGSVLT